MSAWSVFMTFLRGIMSAAALAAASLGAPNPSDPETMGPPKQKGPLWKHPNPPGSGQKINPWDDPKTKAHKMRRKRGF